MVKEGIRPGIDEDKIAMPLNSQFSQVSNWRFRLAAYSTVSIKIMPTDKMIRCLLH